MLYFYLARFNLSKKLYGAIPQKTRNRGVENMEFPGALNKWNVEIPGIHTKRSGIYWGNSE